MADITVQQLKERMDNDEQLNIIDVRESYEHEEFNIGGSLIPLGDLPASISKLGNLKDAEVIVYCRSGSRSGMAAQFLSQNGFSNVRNLSGGMLHWQEVHGS